jgi:hypothetical protein
MRLFVVTNKRLLNVVGNEKDEGREVTNVRQWSPTVAIDVYLPFEYAVFESYDSIRTLYIKIASF